MIRITEEKIDYNRIRHSHPDGLSPERRAEQTIKLWQLSLFLISHTLIFLTLGAYVQSGLGMLGLALTELFVLFYSLGFLKLIGASFKNVFPIRKPKPLALFGCVLMWIGALLLEGIINLLLLLFFPSGMQDAAGDISGFGGIFSWIVICVLPAICEEVMNRGVIQSAIASKWKSVYLQAFFVGGIFALLHIYPIKYPGIFILGAIMSFQMARYKNAIYPSVFHLINNSFSFFVSAGLGTGLISMNVQSTAQLRTKAVIGIVIVIYGALFPILIFVGNFLMRRAEDPVKTGFFPKNTRTSILRNFAIIYGTVFMVGLLLLL